MADPVAVVLGILVTILFMTAWNVITGIIPGEIGAGVNFMAFLVALIVGIVVYLAFSRSR